MARIPAIDRIPYAWLEAARLLGICALAGAGIGLARSMWRCPCESTP